MKFTYTKENIPAGRYNLTMEFYKELNPPTTAIPLNTTTAVLVIDPGNKTTETLDMGNIFGVAPRAPRNLKVEYVYPKDITANALIPPPTPPTPPTPSPLKYKVKFTWTDSSYNEDGFKLTIKGTPQAEKNFDAEVNKSEEIELSMNELYTVEIVAFNDFGESAPCKYENKDSDNKIHMAAITYNLVGGYMKNRKQDVQSGTMAEQYGTKKGTATPVDPENPGMDNQVVDFYHYSTKAIPLATAELAPTPLRPEAWAGRKAQTYAGYSYKLWGWYDGEPELSTLNGNPPVVTVPNKTKVLEILAQKTENMVYSARWNVVMNSFNFTFPIYTEGPQITDYKNIKKLRIKEKQPSTPPTYEIVDQDAIELKPTEGKLLSATWFVGGTKVDDPARGIYTAPSNTDPVGKSELKLLFDKDGITDFTKKYIVTVVYEYENTSTPPVTEWYSSSCTVEVVKTN
ncbi:hypothetical protein DWQ65_05585 [Treponema phagedenis]|uniref:Fibronectin type-III domain-containing protein n=1 Tax=Treponema phagedenis TaxID=162 RepID=A0A0B7GTT5_TREPH|nr:hypothetical protein [Treponema phagedenis]QSH99540.1 hypothetical protein DWQ65_05585 [Treponema phagedenis]CEM60937.1 conserved hypothetical protein [Treponema phagedenis]